MHPSEEWNMPVQFRLAPPIMKIRNDTLEIRKSSDGKIDVFGAVDMSNDYVWIASFVNTDLAEFFIEATWAWIYSEI